MRALEIFHEAEQIRLALRDTLRVQRASQQIDSPTTTIQITDASSRSLSRSSNANPFIGDEDDTSLEKIDGKKPLLVVEGQSLIGLLPDAVVLDEIIGNYLDFDTILLVLPSLSRDWLNAIWGNTQGALLWKRLCLRAWQPLNLPIQKSLTQNNDWQTRFLKRPRIRLSGPYMTYTIFIQHPGPRNLWTPKDAPSVKVVYHYRFWWFREEGKVCCRFSYSTASSSVTNWSFYEQISH